MWLVYYIIKDTMVTKSNVANTLIVRKMLRRSLAISGTIVTVIHYLANLCDKPEG